MLIIILEFQTSQEQSRQQPYYSRAIDLYWTLQIEDSMEITLLRWNTFRGIDNSHLFIQPSFENVKSPEIIFSWFKFSGFWDWNFQNFRILILFKFKRRVFDVNYIPCLKSHVMLPVTWLILSLKFQWILQ